MGEFIDDDERSQLDSAERRTFSGGKRSISPTAT